MKHRICPTISRKALKATTSGQLVCQVKATCHAWCSPNFHFTVKETDPALTRNWVRDSAYNVEMKLFSVENKLIHTRVKLLSPLPYIPNSWTKTYIQTCFVLSWQLERLTFLQFLLYTKVIEHLGSCHWNQFFSHGRNKIFPNTGQHAVYLAIKRTVNLTEANLPPSNYLVCPWNNVKVEAVIC